MLLHLAIEVALILLIFNLKFKIIIKYNNSITSAGTAVAGIVLIINGVIREEELSNIGVALMLSGIILCGLGLYWWLKKESITNFNENANILKSARQEEKISELNAARLELEKTIHTDSKKLPAYRKLVNRIIAESGTTPERERALTNLTTAQSSMLWDAGEMLPPVGIPLVDIILDYHKQRCTHKNINFDVKISGDISRITEIISQSQLETLIANLLDNAVNSHKNDTNQKYITVHLHENKLSVEDNGAAFKAAVLADLARCKEFLTPNRGNGVGIGFVTIFEIANQCGASVEVVQNSETKSVTVRFDGKNRIVTINN